MPKILKPNTLKKIILFSLLTLYIAINISAQKQVNHILRKYKNDENVSNVNLNGNLTAILAKVDEEFSSNITMIDALIFEKGTDISPNHLKDIKSALSENGFELLVNMKNKEGKAVVYVKETDKFIEQVYAQVFAQGINVHFVLEGEIRYEDLSKLTLGFEGSDVFQGAMKESTEGKKY